MTTKKFDYRPWPPDILRVAADEVTRAGDFDLADHLTDLADDYAYPLPSVVVVDLPDENGNDETRELG